jgi:hypothetical protein
MPLGPPSLSPQSKTIHVHHPRYMRRGRLESRRSGGGARVEGARPGLAVPHLLCEPTRTPCPPSSQRGAMPLSRIFKKPIEGTQPPPVREGNGPVMERRLRLRAATLVHVEVGRYELPQRLPLVRLVRLALELCPVAPALVATDEGSKLLVLCLYLSGAPRVLDGGYDELDLA